VTFPIAVDVSNENPNTLIISSFIYLAIISFMLGIPQGQAYTCAIYRALGGKTNQEILQIFRNESGIQNISQNDEIQNES
jgi:hypothetical protein